MTATETINQAKATLKADLGSEIQFTRTEAVGAAVSSELLTNGVMALVVAIILMMIYIWFRFEWQFGLGAVIGLFHDYAHDIPLLTDVRPSGHTLTEEFEALKVKRAALVEDKMEAHSQGDLRENFGFKAAKEVFAAHEAKSPEFKKIHQDMRAFQRDQILWSRFSEWRYDSFMTTAKV